MDLTVMPLPDGCEADTKTYMRPRLITVHWTGPYPGQTPEQVRAWWAAGGEASAHYVIKDRNVLQCWPDGKCAWHCGNPHGNAFSIGVEVIPATTDGEFSEESIRTLRELVASLEKRYGRMPVVRHYDWSGKRCPEFYCDAGRWARLLEEIGK